MCGCKQHPGIPCDEQKVRERQQVVLWRLKRLEERLMLCDVMLQAADRTYTQTEMATCGEDVTAEQLREVEEMVADLELSHRELD